MLAEVRDLLAAVAGPLRRASRPRSRAPVVARARARADRRGRVPRGGRGRTGRRSRGERRAPSRDPPDAGVDLEGRGTPRRVPARHAPATPRAGRVDGRVRPSTAGGAVGVGHRHGASSRPAHRPAAHGCRERARRRGGRDRTGAAGDAARAALPVVPPLLRTERGPGDDCRAGLSATRRAGARRRRTRDVRTDPRRRAATHRRVPRAGRGAHARRSPRRRLHRRRGHRRAREDQLVVRAGRPAVVSTAASVSAPSGRVHRW